MVILIRKLRKFAWNRCLMKWPKQCVKRCDVWWKRWTLTFYKERNFWILSLTFNFTIFPSTKQLLWFKDRGVRSTQQSIQGTVSRCPQSEVPTTWNTWLISCNTALRYGLSSQLTINTTKPLYSNNAVFTCFCIQCKFHCIWAACWHQCCLWSSGTVTSTLVT